MEKPKALLLTFEFPPYPGGIATYSYQTASQFYKMGVSVIVLAPRTSNSYQADSAFDRNQPFPIYRFRDWRFYPMVIAGRLMQTLSLCRRHRFDWVFCTSYKAALGAFLCKALWGIPYFVVGHGSEYSKPSRLAPMILKHSSGLFANSHYTAGLMQSSCANCEVAVVPLGADTEHFSLAPDIEHQSSLLREKYRIRGDPILLSVGRLNARKGHDVTLEALKRIRAVYPNTQLIIIGRSVPGAEFYESQLRKFVNENNLTDNVTFIPVVSPEELKAFYRMADVFILSSRYSGPEVEGFGIVLIEANLMETPVVAATSGGIPEAVEDGKSGFLFENEDPTDLAGKVLYLLRDGNGKEMGKYGRERALEKFSWQIVAKKTLAILQDKLRHERR